jgi:hypothetical protein
VIRLRLRGIGKRKQKEEKAGIEKKKEPTLETRKAQPSEFL